MERAGRDVPVACVGARGRIGRRDARDRRARLAAPQHARDAPQRDLEPLPRRIHGRVRLGWPGPRASNTAEYHPVVPQHTSASTHEYRALTGPQVALEQSSLLDGEVVEHVCAKFHFVDLAGKSHQPVHQPMGLAMVAMVANLSVAFAVRCAVPCGHCGRPFAVCRSDQLCESIGFAAAKRCIALPLHCAHDQWLAGCDHGWAGGSK